MSPAPDSVTTQRSHGVTDTSALIYCTLWLNSGLTSPGSKTTRGRVDQVCFCITLQTLPLPAVWLQGLMLWSPNFPPRSTVHISSIQPHPLLGGSPQPPVQARAAPPSCPGSIYGPSCLSSPGTEGLLLMLLLHWLLIIQYSRVFIVLRC